MTVTENVILPAVTDMCEAVLDANVQQRLRNSFVETISRRICSTRLGTETYFAIELDESTEIASQAQLFYV